jgi:dTDP-4-dehydrorhamnose 3,5-epimerase
MEFRDGDIEGVVKRRLVGYADERGVLTETFRSDWFSGRLVPEMSYVSYTRPEVGRGPHEHREQTDVFAFLGPGNFEVFLWDNRREAETHMNRMVFSAGEDEPLLVIVPPGVVHGYRNTSKTEPGMVLNYPDRLFKGRDRSQPVDEVRHEEKDDEFYRDFTKSR